MVNKDYHSAFIAYLHGSYGWERQTPYVLDQSQSMALCWTPQGGLTNFDASLVNRFAYIRY